MSRDREPGRSPTEPSSESFVDTNKNRNSLTPIPARLPGPDCVHRQIKDLSSLGQRFSEERGHPVFPIKLPSSSVSISIGELAPGKATSLHRHGYESLIYIIRGRGRTLMEGQSYEWQAGDAVYTPPWCWHQHEASDDAEVQYITATNMPLLQNMGQTVLREEAKDSG